MRYNLEHYGPKAPTYSSCIIRLLNGTRIVRLTNGSFKWTNSLFDTFIVKKVDSEVIVYEGSHVKDDEKSWKFQEYPHFYQRIRESDSDGEPLMLNRDEIILREPFTDVHRDTLSGSYQWINEDGVMRTKTFGGTPSVYVIKKVALSEVLKENK
jgi:hypothetical protein